MALAVYRGPNTIEESTTSCAPPRSSHSPCSIASSGLRCHRWGGSSIACLRHGDKCAKEVTIQQIDSAAYVRSQVYAVPETEELATEIVPGTVGRLATRASPSFYPAVLMLWV
ncbi:hypothetical protein C7212DRAFT_340713 [Tuber magnatum]|uniref:Uncharacterized protein n=1 Tax=Tuber magnatum TaxID=42249 RepID=A0A317T411_9PEZI|nr:hypothetical protein C7212DRAFT_340713 [Tuber magnatum]